MTKVGDDTMIIKYIKDGVQKTETIYYANDIHSLNGYNNESLIVRSLIIGKNLSCFGRVATTINNQNVTNYQHFSAGQYDYNTPIVFITFHLIKNQIELPNNKN
jgi:hypothetical protein